jgi:hypothetical protein
MPNPQNLYQDLKNALEQFKGFLDTNAPVIKPAIGPINTALGGRLFELLDKLIALMNQLKTEINGINVGAVPGLSQVSQFTTAVKTLLETSKNLLPNEAATIDDVLGVVNVVSSLPSLDTVKADIISLINDIIGHLNNLKS